MKIKFEKFLCVLLFSLVSAGAAEAQQVQGAGDLDAQIQSIKQQALELNRDLLILEEDLLFPVDSRLTVYLSMDEGDFLSPDAVRLSIDGTQVTHYLYAERQLVALRQGGLQRLYMGNVKAGDHEIIAVLIGTDPGGSDYRREAQLVLEKTSGAKNLEVKIAEAEEKQQPEFTMEEW